MSELAEMNSQATEFPLPLSSWILGSRKAPSQLHLLPSQRTFILLLPKPLLQNMPKHQGRQEGSREADFSATEVYLTQTSLSHRENSQESWCFLS